MKHDETECDSAALHGRARFLECLTKVMPYSCSTSIFQCQRLQRQGPASPRFITCRICLLWMEQVLGRAARQDANHDLPGTSFCLSFLAIHPFKRIASEPVTNPRCFPYARAWQTDHVLLVCLYFHCLRVLL